MGVDEQVIRCICGHVNHAPTEPRVCIEEVYCQCPRYRPSDNYSPFLSDIDKYMKEFDEWEDKMRWVLNNLKFFRNYSNTELVIAWWQYIWPRWNPFEEFLTEQTFKAICAEAKPEAITRARRLMVEPETENFQQFEPDKVEKKILKEYDIRK